MFPSGQVTRLKLAALAVAASATVATVSLKTMLSSAVLDKRASRCKEGSTSEALSGFRDLSYTFPQAGIPLRTGHSLLLGILAGNSIMEGM